MIPFEKIERTLTEVKEAGSSYGKVHTLKDHLLISKGPLCKIGDVCQVGDHIFCEVLAIQNNQVYLLPFDGTEEVQIGDKVSVVKHPIELPPMEKLLGRVIDAFGNPIDDAGEFYIKNPISLQNKPIDAMKRRIINEPMRTGIKAVDGLLTIGEGQRIGIFAGSGVGKSTMLGMIATNIQTDVNVIALIGERAREVKDFIYKNLGEEGMKRSVLVVATSSESPLKQIKATLLATTIAEQFRDQGKKVLLMVDSIFRFAEAKRDLDVAAGEIIQSGGKTPSIVPSMQRVLERAGMGEIGSITGIYTVLVENDDFEATIPDTARGILDGHIILNRKLFEQNHLPAIDVLASISRVMESVITDSHWKTARNFKKYYSLYKENEDAFKIDAYKEGTDKEIDKAKRLYPIMTDFLRQEMREFYEMEESISKMKEIVHEV